MPNKQITSVNNRLLTEVELELMNIIWGLNKATIKDVVSHLPNERKLAYTTVATVMKVLEQKGFLASQKDSFAHVFLPLVSKTDYGSTCIEHMVANVFDGEPVALLQRLLSAQRLRADEIQSAEDLQEMSYLIKKTSELINQAIKANEITPAEYAEVSRHVEKLQTWDARFALVQQTNTQESDTSHTTPKFSHALSQGAGFFATPMTNATATPPTLIHQPPSTLVLGK